MSILNCNDCGTLLDTDIRPEVFKPEFDNIVLCDPCYEERVKLREKLYGVVTLSFHLKTEFLRDILTIAVEGGINYWATMKSIIRDDDGYVVKCEVTTDVQDATTIIDLETVAMGVKDIMYEYVKVNKVNRNYLRSAVLDGDASMIDAEVADCIVQAGAFRKIIYG